MSTSRTPFIVARSCAERWAWPAADGRWTRPEYLRDHPQTRARAAGEDAGLLGFRRWRRSSAVHVAGREALQRLCAREEERRRLAMSSVLSEQDSIEGSEHLYLSAWEYDPPSDSEDDEEEDEEEEEKCEEETCEENKHVPVGRSRLIEDIRGGVPCMPCLLDSSAFGGAQILSRLLRWLYVGEPGSACPAHIDPIASQAWMWVACGEKHWRLAVLPDGAIHPASGINESFPDLFDCAAVAAWAPPGTKLLWVKAIEGELIFVPSLVVHAVRNVGAGLTVAVSHNFVDVACLPETLRALCAALRSLREATKVQSLEAATALLSDQLDAPLFALLSISLAAPAAVTEMVQAALSEVCGRGIQVEERWHDCQRELHEISVLTKGAATDEQATAELDVGEHREAKRSRRISPERLAHPPPSEIFDF